VKKGKSRTDHPTLHAMAKLWIAAAQEPPVIRDMTRMMLLLPARQGNLIHMNWDDIDWRHKVWQIPAPVTKNLESLTLQLSPAVIELLKIRKFPTKGQGLVFPTSKGTAYSGFSALKARLSKAAKLKSVNWRFHDFRRSFVTELANAGFDEVVLDLILNHAASQTRSGVLGVYQQATHMEARKEALHAWADLLLVAVSKIEAKQVEKKSA
jgi:integrase